MILYRSIKNNKWLDEHVAGDYIVEHIFITSISLYSVMNFIKNSNRGYFM